jgi:hypothetical protein
VLNEATRYEDGSGGIVPYILNLGTGWKWVVSFIPRPLCSHGNKSIVYHRLEGCVDTRAPLYGILHQTTNAWYCDQGRSLKIRRYRPISRYTESIRFRIPLMTLTIPLLFPRFLSLSREMLG